MKNKLYKLATDLHNNDYIVSDKIRSEFEGYLSKITKGSRVIHPRFGLGTTVSTVGETWIVVEFDRELEKFKERQKSYIDRSEPIPWYVRDNMAKKRVQITSCISIHMLLKEEMKRGIFNK